MKTDESNLTVEELDELCRRYMDCKLSVLEEKELEYVLSQTSITSSSIEEVRSLMEVQVLPLRSSKTVIKRRFLSWRFAVRIAASVAIILGISVTVLRTDNSQSLSSDNYIIAYINGQEIHGDYARAHIESECRKAEAFISRMAELEEEEQNKIEHFMNHQNDIQ